MPRPGILVASHATAARAWGLPVLDDDGSEHGCVPRSSGRRAYPGVVLHRRDVPPEHLVRGGRLPSAAPATRWGPGTRGAVAAALPPPFTDGPVTTPLRTVLDLARARGARAGLVAADAALRERLVEPALLAAAAARAAGPGAPAVRLVGRHADGRAGSPAESLARLALLPTSLGPVVPQYRLHRDGHPYDLGLPRRRLLVELDGGTHTTPARQAVDRLDGRAAALAGWTLLRYGWHDVHPDPAAFVAEVVEAGRRPWWRR